MAEIQLIPILQNITLAWIIVYFVSTAISMTWYFQLCSFAGKPISRPALFVIIVVIPFYLITPFVIAAIVAARLCHNANFWTNYKFYTVATIYGSPLATERFGERSIFPSDYFTRVFKRFKFK